MKRSITLSIMILLGSIAYGQEVAAKPSSFDAELMISILLTGLMALLAVVIYILGKVLVSTVRQNVNKIKNAHKATIILFLGFLPTWSNAADAVQEGMTNQNLWLLLISILFIELLVIIALAVLIVRNMKDDTINTTETKNVPLMERFLSHPIWNKFNNSKPVSEEKSILMDHDYDGIKELDNDLPPWWKYGFMFTIIWAAFYLFYYHLSASAISSKQEYEMAMEQGEKEVAAYKASQKLNVDETNATLMTEASDLDAGAAIFKKNCTPCHLEDAGGSIGPNLTDKYWIYGGNIKNLFKTIKYGANNGMKAWEELSPIEIQQVASYILSLQGTKPAKPKEPQGDLYVEEGETAIVDSSASNTNNSIVTDSIK